MAKPTEAEVSAFVDKLRAFRDTLPEGEQRLLNSMYYAAVGKHEEMDNDVQAFWVAAGPRGVAAGGYGGWAALRGAPPMARTTRATGRPSLAVERRAVMLWPPAALPPPAYRRARGTACSRSGGGGCDS